MPSGGGADRAATQDRAGIPHRTKRWSGGGAIGVSPARAPAGRPVAGLDSRVVELVQPSISQEPSAGGRSYENAFIAHIRGVFFGRCGTKLANVRRTPGRTTSAASERRGSAGISPQ